MCVCVCVCVCLCVCHKICLVPFGVSREAFHNIASLLVGVARLICFAFGRNYCQLLVCHSYCFNLNALDNSRCHQLSSNYGDCCENVLAELNRSAWDCTTSFKFALGLILVFIWKYYSVIVTSINHCGCFAKLTSVNVGHDAWLVFFLKSLFIVVIILAKPQLNKLNHRHKILSRNVVHWPGSGYSTVARFVGFYTAVITGVFFWVSDRS